MLWNKKVIFFKILSELDAPDILTNVSGSVLTGISGGNEKIIPQLRMAMAIVSNPFGQRQLCDHKPKLNLGLEKPLGQNPKILPKCVF
jgi:hypothetical protein